MLERKITQKLLEWKNEEKKQCLLIRGARQVGKTFIINEFAKNNYQSYIYINFELTPEYKNIFDGNLDIKTLKMKLEVTFPDKKIIPNKTILFLDEIQSCPNARTALKSFALDGTIDVISSGSLLGLYYKEVSSYPVGYERVIDLYPLDFEEFLWGVGIRKETIDFIRKAFIERREIDEYILKQFSEQFKMYILVGGMPNIVEEYIKTSSLSKVLEMQKAIVENYILDVVKFADKNDKQKIINTFNSIPMQLSKKSKKFLYSDIDREDANASERKYSSSVEWLKDAGIINFCYNLSEPAAPLISNIRLNSFKIYMRDTGLLISMLEEGTQKAIMNDDLYINQGALLENVVASEISSRYSKIMYFERKSKLEIDFVLNLDGKVTAIEVKSGNNKQAKALNSIIENYKTVSRYMKFERDCNIYVDEKNIEHYPLFMTMFI